MTEPAIARRCPSCGVSIRELAFFCPQCGRDLPPQQRPATLDSANQVTQPLARDAASLERPEPATVRQKERRNVGQAAMGAVGAKIQRAATIARDAEGDVLHRVQKVREISSVVLDEAGYDPSLRFVLIAAILFFVFLVIVILNKLIS